MKVGEAFIEVRPDTRGFEGQLQGDVTRAGTGAGAAMSRALGAALAGGAAVDFLRDSVGAASDLNEAVSLTEVSFGEAADGVLEMGETSAQSFGLANDEALSFANSIGGLFIGFGETRTEAAAMAEDVVALGADLASAKNLAGGTGEALEILRSGLVGEVEPLRRIGVALNAASVEQRALADTGKTSAAALTEGEKAAARYALIFESLSAQGVVGDFARTAGGAANQQRIFSAELRNTQAEVGQRLLPAFIQLIGAARQGLPLLNLVGDGLSSSAQGASLFASALGPVISLANDASDAIGDMTGGVLDLTQTVPGQIGQITAILDAAKAAWSSGIDLGPISFGGDGDGEGGVGEALGSTAEEIEAAMERLDLSFGGDHRVEVEEWAAAVSEFAVGAGLSFAEALDALNIRGELATAILDNLASSGVTTGEAIGGLLAEQIALDEAASRTNLDAQADALNEIADAADEARDQLEALFGQQQSVAEGAIEIRDRARDLLAQLVELGEGGYRSGSEAGDQFLSTLQEQQLAIIDQTLSIAATTGSYDQARAAQRSMEEGLYRLAVAAGVPDSELQALRATFGTLPRRTLLEVAQQGAENVEGHLGAIKRGADVLPTGKNVGLSTTGADGVITDLSRIKEGVAAIPSNKNINITVSGLSEAAAAITNAASAAFGESAAGGSANVTVNVHSPLFGSADEIVRVVTPAVAGAVEESMRRR